MNPFSLIIALGPIGIYWTLLGLLHLRRRPLVISGMRDLACLGMALIGMFLIGPAELFFPNAAFNLLGVGVWLLILILYATLLLFVVLNSKPRLVVYGFSEADLAKEVAEALGSVDGSAKWLDRHFVSPALQIEAVVEQAGFGRIAQIVTTKREQNLAGWIRLERTLKERFSRIQVEPRSGGAIWMLLGGAVLLSIAYTLTRHSQEVAQGLREMLRL
jgi:hypothetical protein